MAQVMGVHGNRILPRWAEGAALNKAVISTDVLDIKYEVALIFQTVLECKECYVRGFYFLLSFIFTSLLIFAKITR